MVDNAHHHVRPTPEAKHNPTNGRTTLAKKWRRGFQDPMQTTLRSRTRMRHKTSVHRTETKWNNRRQTNMQKETKTTTTVTNLLCDACGIKMTECRCILCPGNGTQSATSTIHASLHVALNKSINTNPSPGNNHPSTLPGLTKISDATLEFRHRLKNKSLRLVTGFSGMEAPNYALQTLVGDFINVSASDSSTTSRESISRNYKCKSTTDSIERSDTSNMHNADMLIAGPPCQTWYSAGDRLGNDDPRAWLYQATIDRIIVTQPKCFSSKTPPISPLTKRAKPKKTS